MVAFIEERSPKIVAEYREKLEAKVKELLEDTQIEENRIAAEVVILADKIVRLRKKNGWSQEELAQKMNVSRQAVSKWESLILLHRR